MRIIAPVLLVLCLGACTAEVSKPAPKEQPPAGPEAGQPAPKVGHVDGAAAGKLLAGDSTVVVLDVRTPEEFEQGHIRKAVNLDFRAKDFEAQIAKLDRAKKYLVHCKSGGRSTSSLRVFEKLGFADVTHLDGGILAWESAGLETEK